MFTITRTSKDGFDLVAIKDTGSNTYAEIIPSCGAILHSFNAWKNGEYMNVVNGYDSKEDFEKNVAAKGFRSCKLSPFACRLKNAGFEFEGTTYTLDGPLWGKHALHGLIYNAAFEVTEESATAEAATLVLKYAYKGTEKGFPFHYDCIVTYQLRKNNELVIKTEIVNTGKSNMPIQDGWHPYFTLNKKIDELELSFRSKEVIIFNDELVPTGEMKPYADFFYGKQLNTSFDNCFLIDFSATAPSCILKDVHNNIQIEIWPSASYPYLQIYTPDDRNSIAIENLSAPPDTFNNGIDLIILSPGEKRAFTTMYKIVQS